MLNHHKATEAEKYALCRWKYEGPYALYDMPDYGIIHQETTAGNGDFYRMVRR